MGAQVHALLTQLTDPGTHHASANAIQSARIERRLIAESHRRLRSPPRLKLSASDWLTATEANYGKRFSLKRLRVNLGFGHMHKRPRPLEAWTGHNGLG